MSSLLASMRGRPGTVLRAGVVAALTLGLLAVAVPAVAGVGWGAAAAGISALRWWWLPVLASIWILGLMLHTVTLTAALPGLTHRRALLLSLTGSAVANSVPAGGAAGIWLNRVMTRGWGHNRADFTTYTVVTNLWDVLAKLALAMIVAPLLVVSGTLALSGVGLPALLASLVAATLAAVVTALIVSSRVATALAVLADRLALRWPGRNSPRWGGLILSFHRRTSLLVARQWGRLTLGMVLYLMALALLFAACAAAAHLPLTILGVLGALAVERMLTLTGLTPGGAGVVELGLTATLIALGGEPAAVLTTVVLYRLFTFVIEIPVGGLGIAWWAWLRRRARALSGPITGPIAESIAGPIAGPARERVTI